MLQKKQKSFGHQNVKISGCQIVVNQVLNLRKGIEGLGKPTCIYLNSFLNDLKYLAAITF